MTTSCHIVLHIFIEIQAEDAVNVLLGIKCLWNDHLGDNPYFQIQILRRERKTVVNCSIDIIIRIGGDPPSLIYFVVNSVGICVCFCILLHTKVFGV